MIFQELKDALNITNGTVTISRNILTSNVDDFLAQYYAGQPIVITGAEPGPGHDANETVVLSGKSSFLNLLDLSLTAKFSLDAQGNVQVTLVYDLPVHIPSQPGDWKFSRSFPELPTVLNHQSTFITGQISPLDDLDFVQARFVVCTQAQAESEFDVPLAEGINFIGNMKPTGVLGVLEKTVGETEGLTLFGSIRLSQPTDVTAPLAPFQYPWQRSDAPGIDLQADLGVDITLGNMVFDQVLFRIYSPHSTVWQEQNESFRPVFGYTGSLRIPSAGITAAVGADLRWGVNEMLIYGSLEGVSISQLTDMLDIAGTGDLISSLPPQIKTAANTLGNLELTHLAVDFSLNRSNTLLIGGTYFTLDMPDLTWQVWEDEIENKIEIGGISCRFAVEKPFSNPAVSVTVLGTCLINGVPFSIQAESRDGFTVNALMEQGHTIPLQKLMESYVPGVPAPDNLTIAGLGVTLSPRQFLGMSISMAQDSAPWVIPVGPSGLTVSEPTLNFLRPRIGSASGTFAGTIAIGNVASMAMQYDIPGDIVINAMLPDIMMMQLVSELTDQDTDFLPDVFDIRFTESSVLIQKQGQNYVFKLGTAVPNIGSLAFQVQKVGSRWGFAAGLNMAQGTPTALAGLDGLGELINFLDLNRFLLVVSTFDGPGFTFPDLAAFNNPTIGGHGITLPAQARGVTAGLNLFADWQFNDSQEQQLFKKLLGIEGDSIGVTLQVGKNPARESRLIAQPMTAQIAGLGLDVQFGAIIENGRPGLFLDGTLTACIRQRDYRFAATLLFVASGALISGSLQGESTIDFDPVKLANVGLVIGVNWGGIPSLGIAATILTDNFQSSLAIFFNSTSPAQSLLAGSISELTLGDVLRTLTGSTLPSVIDTVLDNVALWGTGQFEISGDLDTDLDNLNLESIVTAFAEKGEEIPSATEQILLVANTKGSEWHLTDLTKMRHYALKKNEDTITVSLEPQFYFAPQDTQIGDIPFKQRYFLACAIDIFGFTATAQVDISVDEGFAVEGEMTPLIIGNKDLFSLTATDGSGGPKVSVSTYSQPDHLEEKFRSPHFFIDGQLQMLGLKRELTGRLTKDGVKIDLRGDLLPGINFDVVARVAGLDDLDVGGKLAIDVGTIDLREVDLGRYDINSGVTGQLKITVKNNLITATFSGGFRFAGESFALPAVQLSADALTLADLSAELTEHVATELKDFFGREAWEARATRLLRGGGYLAAQTGAALSEVFAAAGQDAAKWLAHAGYTASQVGPVLEETFGAVGKDAAEWLKGAGYTAGEVGDVLANNFTDLGADAAKWLADAGYTASQVGPVLKETFGADGEKAAKWLAGAGYTVSEVGDVLANNFTDLGADAAKWLAGAGYTVSEVGKFVKDHFGLGPEQLKAVLEGAGFLANEIGDFVRF